MLIPDDFIAIQMVREPRDAPALRRLQRAWLRKQIDIAQNDVRVCEALAKSKAATGADLTALANAKTTLTKLRIELSEHPSLPEYREATQAEREAAFRETIERKAREAREAQAAAKAERELSRRAPHQLEDLA